MCTETVVVQVERTQKRWPLKALLAKVSSSNQRGNHSSNCHSSFRAPGGAITRLNRVNPPAKFAYASFMHDILLVMASDWTRKRSASGSAGGPVSPPPPPPLPPPPPPPAPPPTLPPTLEATDEATATPIVAATTPTAAPITALSMIASTGAGVGEVVLKWEVLMVMLGSTPGTSTLTAPCSGPPTVMLLPMNPSSSAAWPMSRSKGVVRTPPLRSVRFDDSVKSLTSLFLTRAATWSVLVSLLQKVMVKSTSRSTMGTADMPDSADAVIRDALDNVDGNSGGEGCREEASRALWPRSFALRCSPSLPPPPPPPPPPLLLAPAA